MFLGFCKTSGLCLGTWLFGCLIQLGSDQSISAAHLDISHSPAAGEVCHSLNTTKRTFSKWPLSSSAKSASTCLKLGLCLNALKPGRSRIFTAEYLIEQIFCLIQDPRCVFLVPVETLALILGWESLQGWWGHLLWFTPSGSLCVLYTKHGAAAGVASSV